MDCYTSTFSGLVRGITFTQKPEGGAVCLGEEGPRRYYLKVPFNRETPPRGHAETHEGFTIHRIIEASLVEVGGSWTLARPDGREPRTLVRVRTTAPYSPYRTGSWETLEGSPEVIAKGWGAHGAGGVMGTWDDGLVVMAPGDALTVQPEGLSPAYVLRYIEEQGLVQERP